MQWQRGANRPFFGCLTALRHGASLLRRGEYVAAQANLDAMPLAAHASPDFLAGFASQLFALRRDHGRLAELEGSSTTTSLTPTQHRMGLRGGGTHPARTGPPSRGGSPRCAGCSLTTTFYPATGSGSPRSATHLADVAVGLDDVAAGGPPARVLRPYAERQVVLAHGVLTTGSAARAVAGFRLARWEPQRS